MSAPNDSHWPFVSTDKPPLFFNPRWSGQTAPQWSEPWTYNDTQSRKRRRSEVEEVPADTPKATQTSDAADPTQQQPARKKRITPSYRASGGEERFRLSDIGAYVNAWAARIFSGWMTPHPVVCEINNEVQRSKLASQRGQYHELPPQTSRKKTDSEWTAVLQDMNGEVTTFNDRKNEWRRSLQGRPRDRETRDGDVEMTDVDDEMEDLAEEVLLLRHRYNVLGDSALNQHPGIGIRFFTEEELNRSDLPPPQTRHSHQTTVRDEDEEEAFERGVTRAPVMPGSYVSSPPRETTPEPTSRAGDALAGDKGSKYGLIHVLARFGQTVTNNAMNDSSDSSSEGDNSASEESIDSGLESDDSASKDRDTDTEHNASDPMLPLQYPELPASPPTLYNLPAHLIPAYVTRTHMHPKENLGFSPPTKTPTGTADAFDQRRAILNKSNTNQRQSPKVTQNAPSENPTSSTGKHSPSNQAKSSTREAVSTARPVKTLPKAPAPPVIPEITIEPPSNSTRSSSSGSIDLQKLLPPRPAQTRTQRNASRGGYRPKNLSASTTTIRPTKPRLSLPAVRTSNASPTIQRFQKPSSTIMSIGPSKLSSRTNKDPGCAAKPTQNARHTPSTNRTIEPAKLSSSTPSNMAVNASRTAPLAKAALTNRSTASTKPASFTSSDGLANAPKSGSGPGLLGLGNSILGKKKTTAGQSDPTQTKSVSHGNQQNTSQSSGDAEIYKHGSRNTEEAVVCPDCTFANAAYASSCAICKATFVDMSDSVSTSHLHIPGAFPGSTEGNGDVGMQDDEPAFTPVSDEFIVLYKTRASLNPTDPNHYVTGGAGPRGTFGSHGNLIPVSDYEASQLAAQRESASRGPRGAPYFNERIQLTSEEQREYAEIKAWEKRKQLRLHNLEQMKWEKLSDKEKQAVLQRQEQKRQIFFQVQAAADAEARLGNEFFKMLGYGKE